ncbi:MFS general substrate transporter [Cryphonectria parasitica EP155]|uniref:MFS general substrate transporter n=1 Tax=Cryphonectria parasitica (strain ATCC 38755 / EP155) TaxID=660469 RepID=A0A9P4XWU3_CRYP1|nr:MFS general substrate transporter [Cryphonectria parasitica EP155]KAF3762220.1 MFS general substrate transporter [Cryphonectria parasitica EP155]
MTDPTIERRTSADPERDPDVSERSALTKHSDSVVSYGVKSPSPSTSDEASDDGSSSSRAQDEEALIASPTSTDPARPTLSNKTILWILHSAVFISNADATIVMATHAIISSEFMALESSSWLFTGFMLASTVTQTSFGQLSEIYGRKPLIMVAYLVFALGCGVAGSMTTAILGRVLSGSVSAGTSVLVSLVITDILPMREVATWRSYVSVIGVLGRCVGGPLGGWLADVIGWRLSFIGQAPLFLIAIVLAWMSLPNTHPNQRLGESKSSNLRRVDFLGSFLLAAFLLLLLLPLELGGSKLEWTDPMIFISLAGAAVSLGLFILAEKSWVVNPLVPLDMFYNRHTVASFIIMALQCAAQLGMMFSVPLYFQVTQMMSNTAAGTRLLPAVIGNAIGGIITGYLIRNTGKYRWLISLASLLSACSYTLLLLRWHGNTSWWETLYIAPGGFSIGMAYSAVFIAVQVSVDKAHVAPAVSTLYLFNGLGCVLGLAAASAATQAGLRATLESRLLQMHLDADLRSEIIEKAVANIEYVYKAKGDIANAIVASYVDGLWYSHVVSLVASLTAFILSGLLRDYKM